MTNYGAGASPSPNDFLSQLGFGGLIKTGQNNIQNLLSGLPSVDQTRTANAYFSANSGLGQGSDFLRNRGYDLYGQKAEANRQAGLSDLNSLIGSTTSPILANQGQQFQNQQAGAQLGQNATQFRQNLELQKFLANLQAMGLGNSIVNSSRLGVPNFNL